MTVEPHDTHGTARHLGRLSRPMTIITAVVTAVAAVLILAPRPAAAAPGDIAEIGSGRLYLHPNPEPTMRTHCSGKGIHLSAGRYWWSAGLGQRLSYQNYGVSAKTINLGTGAYTWKVCIQPKDNHYMLYSELDPHNENWHSIRTVSRGFTVGGYDYFTWSRLQPQSF